MNAPSHDVPGLWQGFGAVVRRDVLLAWKRPGDIFNPLFFFAMVSTLFPLAVGPGVEQLQFSGPGVVWVAALLATLLSLNGLFLKPGPALAKPPAPAFTGTGQVDGALAHYGPPTGLRVAADRHDVPDGVRGHGHHGADTDIRHDQPEHAGVDRCRIDRRPEPGHCAFESPVSATRDASADFWRKDRGSLGRQ